MKVYFHNFNPQNQNDLKLFQFLNLMVYYYKYNFIIKDITIINQFFKVKYPTY